MACLNNLNGLHKKYSIKHSSPLAMTGKHKSLQLACLCPWIHGTSVNSKGDPVLGQKVSNTKTSLTNQVQSLSHENMNSKTWM